MLAVSMFDENRSIFWKDHCVLLREAASVLLKEGSCDVECEVTRIMAMTDNEVLAECRADGEDPEAVAAEMRDIAANANLDRGRADLPRLEIQVRKIIATAISEEPYADASGKSKLDHAVEDVLSLIEKGR